ncbi:YybH family protein [Pseudoduganella sp. GCM10020061]|uniref:YybH family protein n=1 Tax=Pseudoduganella sp. GCM10020061 TaxID=3317345 RepID=UPI00363304EB
MSKFKLFSRILVAGAAFAAFAGANPAAAQSGAVAPELARTLQKVADAADDAWNRRDVAAMTSRFASDATATIGGTQQLTGKDQLGAFYTNSFKGLPHGMTHRTVVRRIEKLGDMYATDSAVFLEMPDGANGKRVVREFFTFALIRPAGDDWEFVAVRAVPLGPAQLAAK